MIIWIGYTPEQNGEVYRSRSGIITVENLLTPVYIIHGETDIRVPATHSRKFVKKAKKLKKQVEYADINIQ